MTNRDRLHAAHARAINDLQVVRRKAARVVDELDEVTDHGARVPVTELDDEDSAVAVVDDARKEMVAVSERVTALVAVK